MNNKRNINAQWKSLAAVSKYAEKDSDLNHQEIILPHLLRALTLQPKETVLDISCGDSFYSHHYVRVGAKATGLDSTPETVALARRKAIHGEQFLLGTPESIPSTDRRFDRISLVFTLETINQLDKTLLECQRVLKTNGKIHIVLHHPSFRNIGKSSWGLDNEKNIQYRRVDQYMTENKAELSDGLSNRQKTTYYHRPLQAYFKALRKSGFAVTSLEEWIAHKKSGSGPLTKLDNSARKEIPMFIYLEAVKLS